MKKEQMQSLLDSWYRDRDEAPRDVDDGVSRLMASVPQTHQRGRWWPFVAHATDYQPHPIPASNGHSPTVIGRTSSMLSPAKAITAGALVFAVGGVLLIAQPFERSSLAPGAATDDPPAAPVAVTATNAAGGCPGVETTETIGFIERTTGGYCNPRWDWSDDRLDGTVTLAGSSDSYTDGSGLSISMGAMSFENDEGAWRQRPLPSVEFPGAPVVEGAEVWILDGEGAYEGLTAVLVVDGFEPHGFIIDGDLPPAPENASTK